MGKNATSADTTVPTPLHLLQMLTRTLNENLTQACDQARADAQKALDKLDREQQKLTDKLEQARARLAGEDGKASEKRQGKVDELNLRLEALSQARQETEAYIRQLNNDVRQTLRLAKGLERIDQQATQAIDKRDSPEAAAAAKRPATRRTRSRKPAATTPADAPQPAEAHQS